MASFGMRAGDFVASGCIYKEIRKENMSRHETPSLPPLEKLTYRSCYCRQEVKPERQDAGFTLANIVVIERDGSVREVCRRCASLFQLSMR